MFYSRSSDIQFSVYLNNNVRRLWGHTDGDAALKKKNEFKCIIILMSLNKQTVLLPCVLSIEKVY